jgi:hypothetical protein
LKRFHVTAGILLLLSAIAGCGKEDDFTEPEAFSFVVYPGARYLGELTEVTKQGHRTLKPNEEPPPVAIYETDAPVEEVASFYAKSYGYGTVAPDATNNLSATKPPAYYRTGDLATDTKGISDLLQKMNLGTDVSKAAGSYKAAEIDPRPNRPRVTIQRPYFNVKTSQVVDKTIILMSR